MTDGRETSAGIFLTVWCDPESGGVPVGFKVPEKAGGPVFLVTNDAPSLASLVAGTRLGGANVVDAGSLRRIAFPEMPEDAADSPEDGGREALERFWPKCVQRLDAIPKWAHETIALLCSNMDEPGLAALFAYWADSLDVPEADSRWQNSFRPLQRRVERRPLPTLEDCSPLDADRAAAMLGEGGALAREVPGYEPRPGQIRMLRAVVQAFNEGKHLVAEAGTGIGKSLAYLLPAALWARLNDVPVVVSTNTKNLQAQLVEKDLPMVMKVLAADASPSEKPLEAAVIKGRSNYLCLRRFGQLLDGGFFDMARPELRMSASAIAWAATTPDGDFDAITSSGAVDAQFVQNLASGSEECQGRACRLFGRCFVQKARARALAANLVIANHSLVFTELDSDIPVSLPPHAQVVFDEAHNIEEAATNHFTIEISAGEAAAVTRRLVQSRGKTRRGILPMLMKRVADGSLTLGDVGGAASLIKIATDAATEFNGAAARFCRALGKIPPDKTQTLRYAFAENDDGTGKVPDANPLWQAADGRAGEFLEAAGRLKKAVKNLAAMLDDAVADGELNLVSGESADLKAVAERIDEFVGNCEYVINGTDRERVFWIEKDRGTAGREMGAAYAAPVNVGPYLAKSLFGRRSSVVLCSATLSVAGSFGFMASRLGLDLVDQARLSFCTAPSPFDYARQCSLLVPEFMPSPLGQDHSYPKALCGVIMRAAEANGGRTMVLFTSYEMMRECAELVRDECERGGYQLLVQGESGSRNRMTRVFRRDGRCILFGAQSFWEGVDVMGEALSCVVVAKLPFVSPGDPVVAARCEQIDNAGGSSFAEYSVPLAVLRLRQGFGRLIRHRLDKGSVIVADTRIVTKGYGRIFLRSLPVSAVRCRTEEEFRTLLESEVSSRPCPPGQG